jgi:hypothetical protein
MRRPVLAAAVIASAVAGLAGLAAQPASAAPTDTFGTASAVVVHYETNNIFFSFEGQIGIGDRIFKGVASGSAPIGPPSNLGSLDDATTAAVEIPPFTLSGSSPTGSLDIICSGQFIGSELVDAANQPVGEGRASLGCHEPFNGQAPVSVNLNAVYRVTKYYGDRGTVTTYDGGYVGGATDPFVRPSLPIVGESAIVNPNAPIAPGSLTSLCVTSPTLGWYARCTKL